MEAQQLIEKLITSLRESGFLEESDRLALNLSKLLHGSTQDKNAAAELIIGLCHIKAYGDLNITFSGPGREPLLDHLSAIKRAVVQLSNKSFKADPLRGRP